MKDKANIIVLKFGGTSVSDYDRIKSAAERIIKASLEAKGVVVTVSAMGNSTDRLIVLAG